MPRKKMQQRKKSIWSRARSAITGRFMRLAVALNLRVSSVVERVRRKDGQNLDQK